MQTLIERIAERAQNMILQNESQILADFDENVKLAENPENAKMAIGIKIELGKFGTETTHKETLVWEVKGKRKFETDEETYDPNQPGLFD